MTDPDAQRQSLPFLDPRPATIAAVTDRRPELERRLERYGGKRPRARSSPRPASSPRTRRLPAPVAPAIALLPLRLFLAITFIYAGVQKLSDPGFLHPGAPSYIGTLLHDYATGTPGGFVLRAFALPHPALAGVGVAFVEIAVGLLVGVGLVTRGAALVGLALNLLLFLTASWKTYPYFMGADIVFVFGWVPLVLAGTAGQPALEHVLARRVRAAAAPVRPRPGSPPRRRRSGSPARPAAGRDPVVTRRTLVLQALGGTALATAVIAGLASLAKGSYRGGATATAMLKGHPAPAKRAAAAPQTSSSTARHRRKSRARRARPPQGAVRLGAASQLASGSAALYRDPGDGQPDILIRQADGSLDAFSAICTHAGCQVEYQTGAIVCPCHGSVFNARTGSVEQGPAVTPLPRRRVLQQAGEIYALRS